MEKKKFPTINSERDVHRLEGSRSLRFVSRDKVEIESSIKPKEGWLYRFQFLPKDLRAPRTFLLNVFRNGRTPSRIIRHRASVSLNPFILPRAATARTTLSYILPLYVVSQCLPAERDISSIYEAPTGRRISIRVLAARETRREKNAATFARSSLCRRVSCFTADVFNPVNTRQYLDITCE